MPEFERHAFRVSTLAERWDCSPGKVRDLIKSGDLPCLRLGRMVRVPATAVYAYEAESLARKPAPKEGTTRSAIEGGLAALRAARVAQKMNRKPHG